MKATIDAIARDLGIDLDAEGGPYSLGVVPLRRALEAAYRAGEWSGKARAAAQAGERRGMQHGLYVLRWKSGGASLASVGYDESGRNWFSATNWITVPWFDWSEVERAEPVVLEGDWRSAGPEAIARDSEELTLAVAFYVNPYGGWELRGSFGTKWATSEDEAITKLRAILAGGAR